MKSHQFDLRQDDVLQIGIYSVTVIEIDTENGEVVLKIEDPDGRAKIAVLAMAAEPAFA
ncbi:MAG: hypothetical protein R3C19_07440 [Planctomycetaceae bacterium]